MVIAFYSASAEEIIVSPHSVLKIELNTQLRDHVSEELDPFDEWLGKSNEITGLNSVLGAIESAKFDDNIEGISLETTYLNAGVSQLKAIRKGIESFKESGKFVYAYGDVYSQKNYYLCSVADSIFINPEGSLEFQGLSSESLFFKDFQDKFGVKMEVVRHGKYKSAVEPFLENEMSAENRTQIKELLVSLWNDISSDIGFSRDISKEILNNIADNLKARTPFLAKENNLLDGIIYKDEYKDRIKELLDGDYDSVSLLDYIKLNNYVFGDYSSEKIAVIYAQGEIVYGKGDENNIGNELLVKAIEKVKKDKKIKAVVLRVNSPGGSALASDIIWRALGLLKKEKPLVVSMGNLAASGGYYIACNADKIIAEPTTITGSIGVFGLLPNVNKFTENIGIHSERVATNKGAYYSAFEPVNEKFYKVTQEGVDLVYKTFVSKVAKGRNMTFEAVHELAQGRVWSGSQALYNGLVDELGGLDVAIENAAIMADIEDFRIVNYPNYSKDIRESLKNIPFLSLKEDVLEDYLGDENFSLFTKINSMKNNKGIQTRLPYILDIK
jgi:protease-4